MKCFTSTILALAMLFTASGIEAQASQPYTLTYDATDGSLTIDTFGNLLFTYSVKSLGDLGLDDSFIEANHALLPNAPGSFSDPANTSTDDELSQSDFDGWTGLDPFSLGNVLAPGLSEAQFNDILDSSVQNTFYVDELGTLNNPQTLKAFDVVYNVPEPSSIVLFGIGAALLAQRRRNR